MLLPHKKASSLVTCLAGPRSHISNPIICVSYIMLPSGCLPGWLDSLHPKGKVTFRVISLGQTRNRWGDTACVRPAADIVLPCFNALGLRIELFRRPSSFWGPKCANTKLLSPDSRCLLYFRSCLVCAWWSLHCLATFLKWRWKIV